MSSGRCRWALIYLAFGTLTSINNFAAVTASKAGKEGTLKKIKKCRTVTRYRTPPAIVTIVGTANDRPGITFHTNTKNTPSGQPEEGYTWHMKKTFSDKVRDIVRKIPKGKTMTYKEVASKAGNPKAARAVGAVMRSNYDPSIPCHRVVASDGKMRGYNRRTRIR
jgi:methylated-DNA-[protein]-cysteine S-methyltransferase